MADRTRIQAMFGAIAPRYDLTNTVLSLGLHHRWRARATELLGARPGARVLDVACGTGDLALALARRGARVVGLDLSGPMLEAARRKLGRARPGAVRLTRGDALALPFEAASFDAATIAFGIRNTESPEAALRELRRVVRPGGRVLVLEFGQPTGPVFGPLYRLYAGHVLPRLGAVLTKDLSAYRWLRDSAAAFPSGARFLDLVRGAGLADAEAAPLTFGVAYAYRARVPDPAAEGGEP